MRKKILLYIIFPAVTLGSFSSCSVLLDMICDYDRCEYPGCSNKAMRNSVYCSQHNPQLMKDNLDDSLQKVRQNLKNHSKEVAPFR